MNIPSLDHPARPGPRHTRPAWLLASFTLGAVLLLAGCGSSDSSGEGERLQILWMNDTHGYFMPVYHAEFEETDTYAGIAATEGKIGGYAQIATLVKKYKAQNPNSLFLDGGDTFDGSPVAQLTRGLAVMPILNAMGLDAMVPGNRDFSFMNPGAATTDFLKVTGMATFPIVCANLQIAATMANVFPPYIIKQLPNLKVAIIGITSPIAAGAAGFSEGGLSGAAAFAIEGKIATLAAQIRQQHNPDLVIVLSHLGWLQDRKFASRSLGIDAIVGAHTHHNIFDAGPLVPNADGSRDVVVVQAGSHGKFLGKLDLWVKDQKVVNYQNELIRVVSKDIAPDPAVLALSQQAYAPFQTMLDRVIGTSTTTIVRRGDVQSTMGNFLTEALVEIFGADTATSAGIRYGSSIPPGPITVGDVWNMVSPNISNNAVSVTTQTGTQIKTTLTNGLNQEYGADIYNWQGGDVTRFNGRVKYTYKVNAPDNAHIVNLSVTTTTGEKVDLMVNGVDVTANLARVFTFATISSTAPVPNTTAVDEIVKYIEAKKTISAKLDTRTARVD